MAFLSVEHIFKSYKDEMVLNDISISFPSDGMFLIQGESGSGKSTLLKCISGVISSDKGKIFLMGKEVKDFISFRKNYLSFVFQDYQLTEYLSCKDNLLLPLLIRGEEPESASKKIYDILKKYGLEDKMNQKVSCLSGGQKQRIALIRALISDAPILLCDEVTGALDVSTSREILSLLKEISKKKLVIIVSHDTALLSSYCDDRVIIEKGKPCGKIFSGNEKEIKRHSGNITMKGILKETFSNLKKGKFRLLLSISSLSLSFFLICALLCTFYNVDDYKKKNETRFLDYNILSVTKETETSIPSSSLKLVKEELPENNMINSEASYIKIHPSLQALLPSYPEFTGKKKNYSSIQLLPVCESSLKFFSSSLNFTSYHQLILNKEAYALLKEEKSLSYSFETEIRYKNEDFHDEISLDFEFEIIGTEREFEFLNTPKAYYSLEKMEEYFSSIRLEHLSDYFSFDVTLFDRLNTFTYEGDDFSSYKKIVEVKEKDKVKENEKKLKDKFTVSSSSLLLIDEFDLAYASVKKVGLAFSFLSLILSLTLLVQILFSYVLSLKKEIGLYSILGQRKRDICMQFAFKGAIISLASFFIGQMMKCIMISVASYFIKKGEISLFNNYICKEELLFFPCIIFSSVLLSLIPSSLLCRMDLGEVIKEE